MTVTRALPRLSRTGGYPPSKSLSAELLTDYRGQLVRTIATELGSIVDIQDVVHVVDSSLNAFITSSAHVGTAIFLAAPILEIAGERFALAGGDRSRLDTTVRAAVRTAQKGLQLVVGRHLSRDVMTYLREDVTAYLVRLQRHLHLGFDRALRVLAMSEEQLRTTLGSITFGPGDLASQDLERMAELVGITPDARLVVVASVTEEVPVGLRSQARLLSTDSPREALLFEKDASTERLSIALKGQAVVSPPIFIADASGTVSLARRAAELLRERRVVDSRVVVPYADLLSDLIVSGNRMLSELVVQKHLSALGAVSPSRRVALAQLLVRSLESGLPLNTLARELGMAPQTAHSRMHALRSMLGDAVDDPDQRLELIVALRAVLPRWIEATPARR